MVLDPSSGESRHERTRRLRDETESPSPEIRHRATLELIAADYYLAHSDARHAAKLALSGAHAPRVCSGCGERDPMWSGLPSRGWETYDDGRHECPSCLWMATGRPRLLDLFCCEGGASKGYVDAGFDVLGVDIDPQPRYPYEFWQSDALKALEDYVEEGDGSIAAVHASPPCQARTRAQRLQGNDHAELIQPVQELLDRSGLPYVIENVPGAFELRDPVMLCGTMFGLRLYRHRLFETNWPLTPPLHGQHYLRQVKMGRKAGPDEILQPVGNFTGVDEAREAMGMPWASRDGLREAIPPAYTEFIGRQLMAHITQEAAA